MARLPRLIVAGLPHLVSQRVQHQQTLARDAADRLALLERLRLAAPAHAVAVHAYAIRDDRFDLVVTPTSAAGLSGFMQEVARRHSSDFNRRHARSGGLWAGRYRVAVVEADSWLLACMCWVEQQPPTAITAGASAPVPDQSAALSSEAHHAGSVVEPWLTDPAPYWALGNTPFERQVVYRQQVGRRVPAERAAQIEAALRGGWALGASEFARRMEGDAARPATRGTAGRPAKARQKICSVPD